jgi:predicted transglutaminase-like cysteine proteinase
MRYLLLLLVILAVSAAGCVAVREAASPPAEAMPTAEAPHDPTAGTTLTTVSPSPSSSTHPATSAESSYDRDYAWTYDGDRWTWSLSIPKAAYDYYRGRAHDRESDYAQYALSEYDRPYLKGMIDRFREVGENSGYSDADQIGNVVAFVQALPYTSDAETTGYDEYPRYPLETLVDHGGDCEDTAILAAALLAEMGYDTVLIELPRHMAVGVRCMDACYGTYYEYRGVRYFYIETTEEGWSIGEQPPEFAKGGTATIRPMIQAPQLSMRFTATPSSVSRSSVSYRIRCEIENIGSGTAKNTTVGIAALALSRGEGLVWPPEVTVEVGSIPEGGSASAEATVTIPRGERSQIRCFLTGSNVAPVELVSETFAT